MLSLEEKQKQFVTILGTRIEMWTDCEWCHAKLACRMGKFGYEQPCPKCRDSEKYEREVARRNAESEKIKNSGGIEDAMKVNRVAGVFEFKGRNIYTNHKGDIIRDEKWRPLEEGKKDWK